MRMETIIIEVRGGVIQDIRYIPSNVEIEVHDFDNGPEDVQVWEQLCIYCQGTMTVRIGSVNSRASCNRCRDEEDHPTGLARFNKRPKPVFIKEPRHIESDPGTEIVRGKWRPMSKIMQILAIAKDMSTSEARQAVQILNTRLWELDPCRTIGQDKGE